MNEKLILFSAKAPQIKHMVDLFISQLKEVRLVFLYSTPFSTRLSDNSVALLRFGGNEETGERFDNSRCILFMYFQ